MSGSPLAGGRTTTGVVRVGPTVRRPQGPRSAFTRALLRDLEAAGFAGAPRDLGVDEAGRDVVSYLPGEVPREMGGLMPAHCAEGARLLRAFHDATAGSALRDDAEVVCHGDASPCNAVFHPTVAGADFGRRQSPISEEADHPFRSKPIRHFAEADHCRSVVIA